MKKQIYLVIGLIALALAATISFLAVKGNDLNKAKDQFSYFSGTVTDIKTDCSFDGTCSASVDGKLIITGGGLAATAEENTYGSQDAIKIGDKVNVKALKTSDGYTLQRCEPCYIRLK